MKILLITPYQKFSGGVESVNRQLERLFTENGHQVSYLTADNKKNSSILIQKIVGLPAITKREFKKVDQSFDLVICNGEFGYGIDHPHVINLFHGSYFGLREALSPFLKLKQSVWMRIAAFIQKIAAKKKYVIAVSPYLKEVLTRQKIKVDLIIPNAIDTEIFKPLKDNIKSNDFLFVGQNHFYGKGIDILCELKERFSISTDLLTKRSLREYNLNYLENLDHSDLPKLYNKYKMLLFPSRFESSGLVALEAMSCGLPIVMFDVGIGVELQNSIPDFVISRTTKDPVLEYKNRIEVILKNYETYSIAAREYVLKNNSLEKFNMAWLYVVNEVAHD